MYKKWQPAHVEEADIVQNSLQNVAYLISLLRVQFNLQFSVGAASESVTQRN